MRTKQAAYFAGRKAHNAYTLLNQAKSAEQEFDCKVKQLEVDSTQTKLGL
jgi:hypothetical protein